jgi:hypothetical protein
MAAIASSPNKSARINSSQPIATLYYCLSIIYRNVERPPIVEDQW